MLKYSTEGDVLYSIEYWIQDGNKMPDEETLYKAYRQAGTRVSPSPLIVHMRQRIQEHDMFNRHFHTQLRALLRASVHGNLRFLFPMISCVEEMVAAKMALAKAQQDLSLEGGAYREGIPLGIAIETPAAAVLSKVLARECDFFIIDIQNLIRHSLASDYTDQQIQYFEATYNPSIFILVKCAIEGAHQGGLSCGIWGDAVEDFNLIPAFLGLGVNQLFMSKESIDHARKIICRISGKNYKDIANSLLMAGTRGEVTELLEAIENPAVTS